MKIKFTGEKYQGDGFKFIRGQHDIVDVPDEIAERLLSDNSDMFKPANYRRKKINIPAAPKPNSDNRLPKSNSDDIKKFLDKIESDLKHVSIRQMNDFCNKYCRGLNLFGKKEDRASAILDYFKGE